MVNIRQKGANAEREVVFMLNAALFRNLKARGFDEEYCNKAWSVVQRNSLQSAVGGADLTEAFGLSIEVKRHENLQVNTWWKQCTASALRNNEMPVLLYRQNKQKWNCVTYVGIVLPNGAYLTGIRATLSEDDWYVWLDKWIGAWIDKGNLPRLA